MNMLSHPLAVAWPNAARWLREQLAMMTYLVGIVPPKIASATRLGLLLGSLALGSQAATAFTISGTVYGGSTPLANALVKAVLASDGSDAGQSTTDGNGIYSIVVASGTYNLLVAPPLASDFGSAPANGIVVKNANVQQGIVLHASTNVNNVHRSLSAHLNGIPKTIGVVAFERGKFDFAYQELSKLRIKDIQAQYYLGVMSEKGLGTAKDVQGALRWYLRASVAGSAQAQLALGKMFSSGVDLPKNYPEAATWLRRSAEHGLAESQLRLGLMYSNGMGQTQDIPRALAWIGLAADAGAEGANTAQQQILKLMAPADRARGLELKSQLQTKTGMKSE